MDNNLEKHTTERASDDDADSDFDVGDETKKRQPRVRREEDMEEEHEEVEQTGNNQNETAATQNEEGDLWAEPTTEPGNAAGSEKTRGGRGKPSRGRGEPGTRGRGSKERGGGRGRGGPERGRGGSERGRGGERGRGNAERARGERGRGRGTTRGGAPKATSDEKQENPNDNPQSTASEGLNNTTGVDTAVLNDATTSTKSKKPEGKGKRPPKNQTKQTEGATGTDPWALPGTEQEAAWGITPALKEGEAASNSKDGAEASGWGDGPTDGDWGVGEDPGWGVSSPISPIDNETGAKPKRVPVYLNRERVKTGGSERVKLTEEELAQKMEKIRLQNEKIKEKRLEVDADAEKFAAEQAEIQQRQAAQAKIQANINEERRKIADKKPKLKGENGIQESPESVRTKREVADAAVEEEEAHEEEFVGVDVDVEDQSMRQETLFGRTVTPAERLRQHQRALAKAQRELDRERTKLEQQEKKLVADIKKSAKAGQMNACKVMAKDLVRTRRYVQKFYQMRTQLQAVGLRIQTLRSNQQMADAMRGATRAMASMNRGLNLPAIQRIMNEFERESATMDMKEEMMSEAVDGVMEDDMEDEEEEGDKILQQVLEEIGFDVSQQLGEAPTALHAASTPIANRKQAVALGGDEGPSTSGGGDGGVTSAEEDALQERLNRLRGP
ncbi:ESCRT-III subunit protein did4 [Serendipita sp. 399]|nr:ESCRT-III subunit protein did4 [Serendipita sp. 399]